MGSEAPPVIEFNLTGFKRFHGVTENPTESLVGKIDEHMRKVGMPPGTMLGTCTVLESAGEGALNPLMQLLHSTHAEVEHGLPLGTSSFALPDKQVVWVHFGVNNGATNYAVEIRAVNEATFRCPDQLGWQPQREPIIVEDGSVNQIRETTFPVSEIVGALTKEGFDVTESYDAGRFVCNYVYYHSLRHAFHYGTRSLFVHVPLFLVHDRDSQLDFIAALLKVLACFC